MTKRKTPWLWLGVTACSFALANMKVEMFGTGEIDWPHFRFAWVFFGVGLAGAVFSTLKAYHDQSGVKDEPPAKVEIQQPPGKPVPTTEVEPQPDTAH